MSRGESGEERRVGMAPGAPKPAKKASNLKFIIDCAIPVDDGIMEIAAFEKYLTERIKVNGKAGNLAGHVTVTREKSNIAVEAKAPFTKRYLKYLTKKFLKKNNVRDWMRVVASNHNSYSLRYFNIHDQAGDDGDSE